MAKSDVTVLITVGPKACYKQYLPEAIESVLQQTVLPADILIVDDQAHLTHHDVIKLFPDNYLVAIYTTDEGKHVFEADYDPITNKAKFYVEIWRSPWRLGFSAAFNCGMGLADNNLVMFLAADDKLMPTAIEECVKAYKFYRKEGWYAMTYQLQDGTICDIPINIAMITRELWAFLGGFPPSGFAGPDALALSILMKHAPDRIIKVCEGTPLCWLRQHSDQDTHEQASFFLEEMNSIRGKETERFVPNPEWAKGL